jgi:thiamine-phosphate pyrophosphorylase
MEMEARSSVAEEGSLFGFAQALNRAARLARPLPPLIFLTDPGRTPEPEPIAERLPAGAGVIYRSFGAADATATAARLAAIAGERGLVFLVGLDAVLAEASGAAGVHLPERALGQARGIRRLRPDWLITGAAHGQAGLDAAAEAGIDAALLSPVFPSRSPSPGIPMGPQRFAELVQSARLPVYALGGIVAATALQLTQSGAAGLAAIDGVLEEFRS